MCFERKRSETKTPLKRKMQILKQKGKMFQKNDDFKTWSADFKTKN